MNQNIDQNNDNDFLNKLMNVCSSVYDTATALTKAALEKRKTAKRQPTLDESIRGQGDPEINIL